MNIYARPTLHCRTVAEGSTVTPTKKCPYCAETILWDAIICRYCDRDLLTHIAVGEPAARQESVLVMEQDLRSAELELRALDQTAVEAKGSQDWAFGLTLFGVAVFLGCVLFIGTAPDPVLELLFLAAFVLDVAGIVWGLIEGKRRGQIREKQKAARRQIDEIRMTLDNSRGEGSVRR